METLRADSDNAQINGQLVARTHFADKVSVVFKIHSAGFAAAVAGIVEPDGGVEGVARVIE